MSRATGRLLLTLLLLASGGCRAGRTAPASASTSEPTNDHRRDATYDRGGTVAARHYRLTMRLEMPQSSAFARLAPAAKRKLERLRARSAQSLDMFAVVDRILIVQTADQAGGPRELLLCDDIGRLLVVDRGHQRLLDLPRERLPDVLDLATAPSARSDFTATLEELHVADELPRRQVAHRLRLRLQYRAPHQESGGWPLDIELDTRGPETVPRFPYEHPLHTLALPLLQDRRGLLVLETLAAETALPQRWRVTVSNAGIEGPAVGRATEIDDRGWVPLPYRRFSTVRPDLARGLDLPRTTVDGRQVQPRSALGGMRAAAAGALEITNDSSFAAYIYVDGALVAWVAPKRELAIQGLSEGYYRVVAVTPTGVRSWGPRDTYVPGPLTLE